MQDAVSIKKYAHDVRHFLEHYNGNVDELFSGNDGREDTYGLTCMSKSLSKKMNISPEASFVKASVDDLIALIRARIKDLSESLDKDGSVEREVQALEDALYRKRSFPEIYKLLQEGTY